MPVVERRTERGVGIVSDHFEALRGRCGAGHDAEMGEPGKSDHASHSTASDRLTLFSTPLIQMSFSMLVPPVAHSVLKWSYSIAHVGSDCSIVWTSSGGLPLGSTRRRTTNELGPHLQRPKTCALPFSASTSSEKVLRHESSVPSSIRRGLASGKPIEK